MYRHCIHCGIDLGRNEVLEHFPVGRRLAFDAARGRLWVICRGCGRWNLSPLEERWEAVESCESKFRGTTLRVSSENIGLARLAEGLELVRVGAPLRPEFAAWRYGDQFGARRRRYAAVTAATVILTGGVVGGAGLLTGSAFAALILLQGFRTLLGKTNPKLRVLTNSGRVVDMTASNAAWPTLRLDPGAPNRWRLEIQHTSGEEILTGPEAEQALVQCLARINANGASQRAIRAAVAQIEPFADPARYFDSIAYRVHREGWSMRPLAGYPKAIRLGLEMAATEESERRAAQGELELLTRAWREAEEIASVADDLVLSDGIRAKLDSLRRGK